MYYREHLHFQRGLRTVQNRSANRSAGTTHVLLHDSSTGRGKRKR